VIEMSKDNPNPSSPFNWETAAATVTNGYGIVEAFVGLTKDHTLRLSCEADVQHLVPGVLQALLNPPQVLEKTTELPPLIPITVQHLLTAEFIEDIMTTMVETAYSWFRFREIHRHPKDHARHLNVYRFVVQEVDDDSKGSVLSTHWVNSHMIGEALQKMLQPVPSGERPYVNETHRQSLTEACAENDAGNIDADLADCILQVICFNELRYS
jgi:hypothetical protein